MNLGFGRLFRDDANPIHTLLDGIGAPWRLTRSELSDRFGVHTDSAYQWNIIELRTAKPIVDHLIKPLSTQAFEQFSPFVPATHLSAHSWSGDDARANLLAAESSLRRRLGPPKAIDYSNSLSRVWAFKTARLKLFVWPPDMEVGPVTNPSHDRDPRLKTACSLNIETGFRVPLTSKERDWLGNYEVVSTISGNRIYGRVTAKSILEEPPHQNELEFIREPPSNYEAIYGSVGYSQCREALIFCHAQLYVIPMNQVVRFQVQRTKPAKGPGGSLLEAECLTKYEAMPVKSVPISSGEHADDLNGLAETLADATGKPMTLSDYYYDC